MRTLSASGNAESGYALPEMTAVPFETDVKTPATAWPAWFVKLPDRTPPKAARLLKAQTIQAALAFLVEIYRTDFRLLVSRHQIVL